MIRILAARIRDVTEKPTIMSKQPLGDLPLCRSQFEICGSQNLIQG